MAAAQGRFDSELRDFHGSVLRLVWFVLSRGRNLVPEADILEGEWIAYDTEWARDEDEIVRAVEGDSPSE